MRNDNRRFNIFMIMSVSALLMCMSHCVRAYPTTIRVCEQQNKVLRLSDRECVDGTEINVDQAASQVQTLDLSLRPYEKLRLQRMHEIRAIKADNNKKIKLDILRKQQ